MNSDKLKLRTVEINKDLFKSVKSAQSKWELSREEKKQHQKKTDLQNHKTLICGALRNLVPCAQFRKK